MFGEGFGNFFERFPVGRPLFYTPLHHEVGYGIFQIPIFRVEVFTPLLLLSIGFGVLQVVGGWVIRAIQGAKHAASTIKAELGGADPADREPFQYLDKGSMATVSRSMSPVPTSPSMATPMA